MSGKILARVSALSLVMLLAACGGDGDSTPLVDTDDSTPVVGSDNDTGDAGADDQGDPTNPENPGNTTTPPILSITATPDRVIAGNSSRITISAVDADGNKIASVNNQIILSSICATSNDNGSAATFENNSLTISEGEVFTNYTPSAACVGTDTISARWNGNDGTKVELKIPVLQAPPSPNLAPNLSIVADPPSVIAGSSSTISISALDADGDKVTGTGNKVTLSSVCAASDSATFSNASLNISDGAVFTNYTPSAACVGTDTITARWNGSNEIKGEFVIEVIEPQTPDLALGNYMGGVFLEGEIEVLDSLPLSNTEPQSNTTRLSVDVYDKANNRLFEGKGQTVNFYSSCSVSGWASFDKTSVIAETGDAKTVYALIKDGSNNLCTTSDTVYARLNDNYSIKAKVNIPIVDTNTPEPVLKVGLLNGTSLDEGSISADPGNLKITTGLPAPETELRFDIVNARNNLDFGSHTYQFTSMCLDAGRANITGTSGSTQSGKGIATYIASENCLGTDTVSVVINNDSDLRASIDLVVSEQQVVLGSLDGAGGFNPGVLNVASNQLGYNSNQNTTTDILTAVALEDGTGGFDVLRGTNVSLDLFSTCTESNRSTITSTGTTQTGELISLYTANDCVGDDVIYGRITGGQELASGSVTIAKKKGLDLQLGFFDSSGSNFTEGVIGNTRSTALLSGVQTKLFLSIVDNATAERVKGQPLTVEFTSQCGELPNAESPLSTQTSTISLGYTEILYTAQSCGSSTEDIIIATLTGVEGLSATAEATIKLDKAPANSLTAGLPVPNSIAPAWYSTADRETTSVLKVQLKDNDNNGISNETISFRLDNPGTDDVADLQPVDGGRTDAAGFATVNIKAITGFDNVVFRVVASYDGGSGNTIDAYSAPIAVNSKLPFEPRFSISTSNFAPDVRGIDGVRVPLILLAADDEGNRIRGNTVVNFETNIGSIEPECVLDNDGRCSVTWESLNIASGVAPVEYAVVRAYTHGSLSPSAAGGPGATGEIETSTRMLMTTSTGVAVSLSSQTIDPTKGGEFCAEASVDPNSNGNKYSPPVGTTMKFEVTNATLLPASSSSFTLGSSSVLLDEPKPFTGCTFVEPDPDRTEKMKLTVIVTPPNGTSVKPKFANES